MRIDKKIGRIRAMENSEPLVRFYEERKTNGCGKNTLWNYLNVLGKLLEEANKPFESMTKEDIIKFLDRDIKESSKNTWKVQIKSFFKWLGQEEKTKWIEKTRVKNRLTREDLLSPKEINQTLKQTKNSRSRAM
ncbi:MAG: phage integrase N-terminal SAM-like domain-containing protein, partial [Candidatus Aenigmatarchaeota archaeon]